MQGLHHLASRAPESIVNLCEISRLAMNSSNPNVQPPYNKDDMAAGELWNGRLAMIGFVSAIATELLLGQSMLPKVF